MADVQREPQAPPPGRYGGAGRYGATAGSSDRGLKITGGVLGVLLLGLVGWIGVSYVAGADVSGSMIKFRVASEEAVEVHLEVRKEADVAGVCTLRVVDGTGGVVGRKDVRFESTETRVDRVVTVRTTRRAVNAELTGCRAAEAG
ncbi:DUF4307 domain-containing protein [Streptomyces sp. JJ36]|uniref:DUF4307 domain-containing protein n=1 Tax=Streptomyces sp. JJ36 TaxID=2736645 RepID=UPI001F3C9A79|nr:DUF4307 domain-containing protein [Streptomyces sp. JJ36]MCF6522065.1 DUF4307 domain-containing protein [Streptomyces sp. JJ36]